MTEIDRLLALLASAPTQPATLATLVEVEGSSYRRPGARLVVLADGTHAGSISGGCLEEDIRERAARVLATGRPELAVYDTTNENDLVWGVGLGCQGIVRILLERLEPTRPAWLATLATNRRERRATALAVRYAELTHAGTALAEPAERAGPGLFVESIGAPPALLLCGAGDDARPLARIAREIGWHVTVTDARRAYATAERFPEAHRVIAAPVTEALAQAAPDENTFVVVMTHRYGEDREWLRGLLPLTLPYLGQLGPRKRTDRILAEIGPVPPPQLAKLHAPVGLDLGGREPESVALAIVAELQAVLARRPAGFLRDHPGPIHA